MNCVNHIDREGVYSCSYCGDRLCQECSIDADGRSICKNCVKKLSRSVPPPPPVAPPRHYTSAPTPPPAYSRHRPSRLVLFMLSAIPGANHMYLGLMKRGLFVLSMFALSIYLTSLLGGYPAAIIPIIAIASFFDGFNLRRKIIDGVPVSDSVSEITNFLSKYKLYIIGFFLLGLFSSIFRELRYLLWNIRSGVSNMYYSNDLPKLLGFAFLIFVIVLLMRKRGKKSKLESKFEKKDDYDRQ